jgi:uncharacterized protein
MDHQPHLRTTADPLGVGIGLKHVHYDAALSYDTPLGRDALSIGFLEVHPQNYFGMVKSWGGGPPHAWLSAFAEKYPLSFHSVGLSLGSADGLNRHDLTRLVALCDRYNPVLVSDHISFSGNAHDRIADLLPVPYTAQMCDHFATQINVAQQELQRQILVENPSRYLAYAADEMDEATFIEQLIARTGCGILLDINNVQVSANNLGFDAADYLRAIRPEWVGEIHLAGHSVEQHDSGPFMIDDHGSHVTDFTWNLLDTFIERAGPKPILIEWDSNIPSFDVLIGEAAKAQSVLTRHASTKATAYADAG